MTCGFFSSVFHTTVSNHHWDFSKVLGDHVTFFFPHACVFSWAALNKMFCTHYILQQASITELQLLNSAELKIQGKEETDHYLQKINLIIYIIQSLFKILISNY